MRFRKGSRVEVFCHKELPYCAWRAAEIISGNGHTYDVRYYSFEVSDNETLEDRVPRKMIRPCPPQIAVDRCELGVLVEVLDHGSWKTAKVLKEVAGKYYVVQLLGAGSELIVHKASLRARHSWQDDKWVVIGKVSCSVKRPSPCSWSESAESCTGNPKKIRSVEEGGHQHLFASSSVKKTDAAASGAVIKGVKLCVQASANNKQSCYDTDASSVGSCSPISYDEAFLDRSSQASNTCSGDAETSLASDGKVRPELLTYRTTLAKLYAAGPLNWDQEAALTDLRLSLNISSDEHRMELRNLKSDGTHSRFR